MKKSTKQLYNQIARDKLEEILNEYGMKMNFISAKSGIENTTLSKWKNKVFDFKEDKLNMIEGFISRYK